ncbi:MAG: stage III sporulation protein AD, partial [Clostridiales bacterium]|nr:stage III sporulation protein AD [Clostridiales bacterium]
MGVFQLAAFALLAASFVMLVRVIRPEMALQVSVIAGLIVLAFSIAQLTGILESLRSFAAKYNIDTAYVAILLKIIGIAYVVQFAGEICKDAGENALASKV